MSSTPKFSAESSDFADCRQRATAFRNLSRSIARDEKYFDWRYLARQRELGMQAAFVVWLRDAEGRDVAAASVIPHPFRVDAADCQLGMIGDVSVAAAWQGKGLATQLMKSAKAAACERGLSGCFVLPNDALTGALLRAGFHKAGEIRRSVLPIAAHRFGTLFARLIKVRLGPQAANLHVASSKVPHPHLASLFDELCKPGQAMTVRSEAISAWRFVRHPESQYQFLHVLDGNTLAGAATFHIESGILVIDDLLVADRRAARELLRYVVDQAAASACHSVQRRLCSAPGRANLDVWPVWFERSDFQNVMVAGCPGMNELASVEWYVSPADKDV